MKSNKSKSVIIKISFSILVSCLLLILPSYKTIPTNNHKQYISTLGINNFGTTIPASFSYVKVNPINLAGKSNLTISGDSINGKYAVCLQLSNCTNIHITKCKLMNSVKQGIVLKNCSNILIDSCYFENVSAGVYAQGCTGTIRVNSNQFLNMRGPFPGGNFVQLNNCSGGGNQINYNKCEDIFGAGTNPNPGAGDGLSLYQSNGIPTSPIQIYGNWIRGGGTNVGAQGMAGIVAGDVGGSWQDIENNIVVNGGAGGIQQQGGSHITIKYNTIYGANLPWSGIGLATANFSGVPSASDTIAYNTINWFAGQYGVQRDTVWKPGTGLNTMQRPYGWNTNIVKAGINAGILPAVIITESTSLGPGKVTY